MSRAQLMPPTPEEVEKILDRIHEWTRAADQKAMGILRVQTAVPAILADTLREWWTAEPLQGYRWAIALASVIWAVSVACSTTVLLARTKNKAPKQSVTFFGDIAGWKLAEFQHKLTALTADDYREDFVNQAWVSAAICATKHTLLR